MTKLKIIYMKKRAVLGDIHTHLVRCDKYFIPPLSERVNIDDYSDKFFFSKNGFIVTNNDMGSMKMTLSLI